ncbi:MAG: carbohydrate binding domain-containing protein [Sedimentisphaerales bacterium]
MSFKHFCIFLIFAATLSSCYGDTNLLTNPGFESGTTGWSGFGCSFTTSTTIYHSGTKSGYAYGRTATGRELNNPSPVKWKTVKHTRFLTLPHLLYHYELEYPAL